VKRIKQCSVEGCGRLSIARNMCMRHYLRWYDSVGGNLTGRGFSKRVKGEEPTPHEKVNFIISRDENERWHQENTQRLTRWLAVGCHPAYVADHAADRAMAAD
jgi:hypothetical protein